MIVPSATSVNAVQRAATRGEGPIRPKPLKLAKVPGVPRVPYVPKIVRYVSFRQA